MASPSALIENDRNNAAAAWILVLLLVVTAVRSLFAGAFLWSAFAAVTAALVLVPTVRTLDPAVMVPWPLALLAAVPFAGRLLGVPAAVASHLTVAVVALVVAVELDAFTPVEMNARFAVVFVVTTTMAVAAVWAVARFASDRLLGTTFLTGPNALMWDLIIATGTGVVAGVLFEYYFHEYEPGEPSGIGGGA